MNIIVKKLSRAYKIRVHKRTEKNVRKSFGNVQFSQPPATHVLLDRLTDSALIERMEAGE